MGLAVDGELASLGRDDADIPGCLDSRISDQIKRPPPPGLLDLGDFSRILTLGKPLGTEY